MPKIVNLVNDGRSAGGRALVVDGKVVAVDEESTVKTTPALDNLSSTTPIDRLPKSYRKTYERALRMLGARARSSEQLRQRLLDKGEGEDEVRLAIERLNVNGLLNDQGYAETVAQSQMLHKKRSIRRVKQELTRRGVHASIIEGAVQTAQKATGLSDQEVAEAAARKKLNTLKCADAFQTRNKLYAYLARQGFSSSSIKHAIGVVLKKTVDVDDDESE